MNSREYLEKAISICPSALEVDVRISDGILVLDHGKETRILSQKEPHVRSGKDSSGVRSGFRENGREETSAEKRDPQHAPDEFGAVLTLEECLEEIRDTGIHLNADLKTPGLEDDVLALAAKIHFDPARIIFTGCIADPGTMLRRIGTAAAFANPEEFDAGFYRKVSGFADSEAEREYLREILGSIRQCGYTVVNVDYRVCGSELAEICCSKGLQLSLWTIDDVRTAEKILGGVGRGIVANITTNIPSAMKQLALQ